MRKGVQNTCVGKAGSHFPFPPERSHIMPAGESFFKCPVVCNFLDPGRGPLYSQAFLLIHLSPVHADKAGFMFTSQQQLFLQISRKR